MSELDWLAGRFEQNRARLRSMALRMLGSGVEADDAVQEAWLRVSRADAGEVANSVDSARTRVAQARKTPPPAGWSPPPSSGRPPRTSPQTQADASSSSTATC